MASTSSESSRNPILVICILALTVEASTFRLPTLFLDKLPPKPVSSSHEQGGSADLNTTTVWHLMMRSYNFSAMCTGHVIRFRRKQLNVDGLTFSFQEAVEMSYILEDDTLEDRMAVWTYTCEIEVLEKTHQTKVTVDTEKDNQYESDILISPDQMRLMYMTTFSDEIISGSHAKRRREAGLSADNEHVRIKRKMLDLHLYKWPLSIGWWFTSTYSTAEKNKIMAAISHWQSVTCLKFHRLYKSPPGPHIQFLRRSGCFAQVGMHSVRNIISIDNGCFGHGKIMHEIAHALGMWHEHSRPDRDLFVNINWNNIKVQKTHNFVRRPWLYTSTLSTPYDFASVMHYGSNFFAAQPADETLVAKVSDYKKSMAQCGGSTLDWSRCQHDGYRDPSKCNQCRCPTGLAPPHCKRAATGSQGCGGKRDFTASNKPHTLSTANFPNNKVDLECFYRITVPKGWIIKMTFDALTLFSCNTPCIDYVELRMTYLGRSAPRYCCHDLSGRNFQSPANELLLIVKARVNRGNGIRVSFIRGSCGGCQNVSNQIYCERFERNTISGLIWTICYRPIPSRPADTYHYLCKRRKEVKYYTSSKYCCSPYILSTDKMRCVLPTT